MKIAVLAGGWSPEREVSLTSGTLIANALIQNGHEVALVDVYCGTDLPAGGAEALFGTAPLPPHTVGRFSRILLRSKPPPGTETRSSAKTC